MDYRDEHVKDRLKENKGRHRISNLIGFAGKLMLKWARKNHLAPMTEEVRRRFRSRRPGVWFCRKGIFLLRFRTVKVLDWILDFLFEHRDVLHDGVKWNIWRSENSVTLWTRQHCYQTLTIFYSHFVDKHGQRAGQVDQSSFFDKSFTDEWIWS